MFGTMMAGLVDPVRGKAKERLYLRRISLFGASRQVRGKGGATYPLKTVLPGPKFEFFILTRKTQICVGGWCESTISLNRAICHHLCDEGSRFTDEGAPK
jgi:hypothetical protein